MSGADDYPDTLHHDTASNRRHGTQDQGGKGHGHEDRALVRSRLRQLVAEVLGAHSHDPADHSDATLDADSDGRKALTWSLAILGVTAAIAFEAIR